MALREKCCAVFDGRVPNWWLLPPLGCVGPPAVDTSVSQHRVRRSQCPPKQKKKKEYFWQLVTFSSHLSCYHWGALKQSIQPQLQQGPTDVSLQGLLCKTVAVNRSVSVCASTPHVLKINALSNVSKWCGKRSIHIIYNKKTNKKQTTLNIQFDTLHEKTHSYFLSF